MVVLLALPAGAQPVLQVRARARLDLDSIRRAPRDESRIELTLRGHLIDADVNSGIDQGTVVVDIEGPNGFFKIAVATDQNGGFEVRAPLKPGDYQLRMLGGKDDPGHLYDRAQPIERALNLLRTTPMITVKGADEASAGQQAIRLEIETQDPGDDLEASNAAPTAIELPVTVFADGKRVEDLITHGGRAGIDVPVSALGKPGTTSQLVVRFGGDSLRNPTEATHPVKITTPTQLTLTSSSSELAWRGHVDLSGVLADLLGPVAGGAIELTTVPEGRVLGTATSDDKGRFEIRLEGGKEKPGTLFVEARYSSGPSFREGSRSPAVALTLLAPAPHPLGFWLSPLITIAAIGGVVVARKKPWRSLARRRAAALERKTAAPTAGLTENRPRLLSTLRPANDHGLSGQIVELPSLRAVVTATVVITAGEVAHTITVDEHGNFAVEDLPAGAVIVEVSAPGYVPERFRRAIPHRGELRQARVTLVPIRERIFAAYRAAAVPLLPEPRLAETWTPRELLRHVRRKQLLVEDLDALTRLVEVAYFGARLPDATVLAEAERLAGQVSARAAQPRS